MQWAGAISGTICSNVVKQLGLAHELGFERSSQYGHVYIYS